MLGVRACTTSRSLATLSGLSCSTSTSSSDPFLGLERALSCPEVSRRIFETSHLAFEHSRGLLGPSVVVRCLRHVQVLEATSPRLECGYEPVDLPVVPLGPFELFDLDGHLADDRRRSLGIPGAPVVQATAARPA